MRHRTRLVDVLSRAETRPIMDEADFERRMVAPTIKKLVEEYELSFDGSVLVPNDDELADRVFQAGLAFAAEVGMYCQDTNRRITFTRRELEEGLRFCAPSQGSGCGHPRSLCVDDNFPAVYEGMRGVARRPRTPGSLVDHRRRSADHRRILTSDRCRCLWNECRRRCCPVHITHGTPGIGLNTFRQARRGVTDQAPPCPSS